MKFLSSQLCASTALTLVAVFVGNQNTHAQEVIPATPYVDNTNVYTPDYFTQYAPRTASDMVARIPGFQIDSSSNKRGLGNGGANVLINGERISGKTSANIQLLRINAENVVRIEIVDGTSLDIPGLTGEVANIITKTTKLSGSWNWDPQIRDNLRPKLFNGSVTVSGEAGNLSYSARLRNHSIQHGGGGIEQRFLADDTLIETRDEDSQFYGDVPGIATSLTWKPKPGHTLNLNAAYNVFTSSSRERSQHIAIVSTPNDSDNNQTLFSGATDEWNAEIDGDYEFPAGPEALGGKLKLIGYYRFKHSPTISRFDTYSATGPQTGHISGSRFFRTPDEAEAIARAEYSWSQVKGKDWQIGVEGTFNYLDVVSDFLILNPTTGDFFEVPLPGSSSRVEEFRTEATLTHSRTLSPKWDVQISGGVEYSEISQTGVNGQVRNFIRPKGFISTTYKPNDSLNIRTRIEREVGQLNFFDFTSSLNFEDELNDTGNANLVPEQSWLGSVEFDKDLGAGNTFKAKFYGELISDLVDRIPVGLAGDAVGNISNAARYGVDFNATLKGDKWGVKGTQLDLALQLRKSSVDDPLTDITRRLNNDIKSYWKIDFRHDIPNTVWTYGTNINQRNNAASFRLSTISQGITTKPSMDAYIEHKDIFGLKVRVTALNILGQQNGFTREIFTARRDVGVLDIVEIRNRQSGTGLRFNVSGTF